MDENKIYLDEWYNIYYPKTAHHGFDASPEVLAMASPHWLTFPPVHPFVQHFFGVFFFFLWIVCSSGNAVVVYIFLKRQNLRTPSNMLIVALAVSDFIMMWTQAPPLFIGMLLSKFWPYGQFWCKMYGFTGGVFGCASLWLIILIGFDRYNVIVKGLQGTKITSAKAFFMIVFAFSYSTITVLPAFLEVWSKFSLEGLLVSCSFDYLSDNWTSKSYSLFIFFFDFCVPLMFISYFYSFIVKAVVAHERALREQAKKMNVESLRSNEDASKESTEVRIAKVALTAVCLWLLAWTPYATTVMLAQFGPTHLITPVAAQFPSMLSKVASCFNPIIYAISHPKYDESGCKDRVEGEAVK